MKLTIGILAITITMTAGATLAPKAQAQNTDAIDNARSVAKSLQQKQEIDTNAALDAAGVPPTKPAPGAPAPAVKPAVIPGSNPVPAAPAPKATAPAAKAAPAPKSAAPVAAAPVAKTVASPASKAVAASSQLQRVNVVQGSDSVRVEIIASHAVTPKVSKLEAPARVLVELPATSDASPQNHISFGSAGVKGVRIGTDGKTPPTTSVVVDLDKACTYDLTPGQGDKLVLTLHTDAVAAKSSPAQVKTPTPAPAAKPQTVAKSNPAPVPTPAKAPAPAVAKTAPAKAAPSAKADAKATKPAGPAAKPQDKVVAAAVPAAKPAAPAKPAPAAEPAKSADASKAAPAEKKEDKKWAMSGKRDPFFSPVVQTNGSGCSTGKKCLEIGAVNLRGVVKSDTGFIAVVTNNLNKAYFLRENDPVFNGYVMKITGDSIVFSETVQDKLGKPFTREVVKRIFTPAV